MIYTVRVGASKIGSIGAKYGEKRTYIVVVEGEGDHTPVINMLAIKQAYKEGLEHVGVESISPRPQQ